MPFLFTLSCEGPSCSEMSARSREFCAMKSLCLLLIFEARELSGWSEVLQLALQPGSILRLHSDDLDTDSPLFLHPAHHRAATYLS